MATTYVQLVVAHDETSANDQQDLYAETGLRELAAEKIQKFMRSQTSGGHPCSILTRINSVKASGTITLSAHVATNTVTINGVTLTAVSGAAGANQYDVSGGDTTGAASLVLAIAANATLASMVQGTSALGVVTVTAVVPGAIGNAVTLAISANGSVSAARMAGGTNGDTETTHYFGSGT